MATNDNELRLLELHLSDPYEQEGIVWAIPPGVELVETINTYSFGRWPQEKVKCIKCDGRRHKHGFTALLSDGSRALFGSRCGEDVFEESWTQARNRLWDRRTRQALLFRLDDLLPVVPNVLAGLRDWRHAADRLSACRRRFQASMPSLFARISDAAWRGGRLIIYERVRDLVAEERAPVYDKRPRWTHVAQPAGTTAGSAFFDQSDPVEVIDDAVALLREVVTIGASTDSLMTREMRLYDRRIRETIRALELVLAMHRGAIAFFHPDNLKVVAGWATRNQDVDGSYQARDSSLLNKDTGELMALPGNFPAMLETPLMLLRSPESGSKPMAA